MMNQHPFTPLAVAENQGSILLTPCPGTKDAGLQLSLEQLQKAGAKAVLTLMPNDEMERNGVLDMPVICKKLGMSWIHLPIEDDCAPRDEFFRAWEKHAEEIHGLLQSEKNIAIHCKGGSGRTGLVAAQILIERGQSLQEASALVKQLRPNALRLAVHRDYLQSLTGKKA